MQSQCYVFKRAAVTETPFTLLQSTISLKYSVDWNMEHDFTAQNYNVFAGG